MAPEQLLGGYDERSDLYSAALILLQALKGKPSENESGGLAGALRRATGDTDFRKHLPAGLPASWRYVLLRCLERDPSRRPASAQEAQELLTQKRSRLCAAAGNVARSRSIKISVGDGDFVGPCRPRFSLFKTSRIATGLSDYGGRNNQLDRRT